MTYNGAYLPRKIPLGHQGENRALTIEFDMSDVYSQFPGAATDVVVQRPGEEEFYFPDVTTEENIVIWHVTNFFTELDGVGYLELRSHIDGVVVKSNSAELEVKQSLMPKEVIEYQPTWYDSIREQVLDCIDTVDDFIESATVIINGTLEDISDKTDQMLTNVKIALLSMDAMRGLLVEAADRANLAADKVAEQVAIFNDALAEVRIATDNANRSYEAAIDAAIYADDTAKQVTLAVQRTNAAATSANTAATNANLAANKANTAAANANIAAEKALKAAESIIK